MLSGGGLLAAFVQPVLAQPAAPSPSSVTVLHLSASEAVRVAPDELATALIAQAALASPAAAQRRVIALMADGMTATRGVAGVDAQAVGYSVAPVDASWSSPFARKPHQAYRLIGRSSPRFSRSVEPS